MKKDRVEEWNQLLKGTMMGQHIFQMLRLKCRNFYARDELEYCLTILKQHQKTLIDYLKQHNPSFCYQKSFSQRMIEWMCKIKYLFVQNDKAIVQQAIQAILNGKKALHIFMQEHKVLEKEIQLQLQIMRNDYELIYSNLKSCKCLLNA